MNNILAENAEFFWNSEIDGMPSDFVVTDREKRLAAMNRTGRDAHRHLQRSLGAHVAGWMKGNPLQTPEGIFSRVFLAALRRDEREAIHAGLKEISKIEGQLWAVRMLASLEWMTADKFPAYERPIIPVLSDAEINEAAKSRGGDTEKVATTSLDGLTWLGVALNSRYNKAHEYEAMVDMVNGLESDVEFVESIFCDSKAGCTYEVRLKHGDQSDAVRIGQQLDAIIVSKHSGHNGIYVRGDGVDEDVNPNWAGADDDEGDE